MKKIMIFSLLFIFIFTLSGCVQRESTTYTLADVQSQITEIYDQLSPMTVAVVSYEESDYAIKVGHGSGLIYDRVEASGTYTYYVITNYHVVESQAHIRIYNGAKYYNATPFAVHEPEDLALVTFNTTDDLPYYGVDQFSGNRIVTPVVGSFVIAIGTPLDLDFFNTATIGIVGRTRNNRIVQHDAAINPGNSGGPLFDLAGNLLGFNTWKRTTTITSDGEIAVDGIGFAISMTVARSVVTSLRVTQTSVFESAKIGITVMNIADAITNKFGGIRPEFIEETQTAGVYVDSIVPLRPAVGKLFEHDIITHVNDEIIVNLESLGLLLSGMKFGDTLNLTVRRYTNNQFVTVQVSITV